MAWHHVGLRRYETPQEGGRSGAGPKGEYMAWHHVGLRRYYYRTVRVGRRRVRHYVGTGAIAELAAAADDLRRMEREITNRERQVERDRYQGALDPLIELCGLTNLLARAALVAAGYHQHSRGAWRRDRGHTSTH